MKYRKLRIAFSAVCGIICLLLIVSWVRSHFAYDAVTLVNVVDSNVLLIQFFPGSIAVDYFAEPVRQPRFYWMVDSSSQLGGLESNPLFFRLKDPEINSFIIRHWFLVVLSGGLAALSWRWLPIRFSLRTLLIAITIIGLILGTIIATSR